MALQASLLEPLWKMYRLMQLQDPVTHSCSIYAASTFDYPSYRIKLDMALISRGLHFKESPSQMLPFYKLSLA
jgi:hypothetical protein